MPSPKTELVAERSVTEIHYAEITVTISLPRNNQTATTKQLIDDRKLEVLYDLVMPEHLRMADKRDAILELKSWENRNQEARDYVDWFAKGIAHDICFFMSKEFKNMRR